MYHCFLLLKGNEHRTWHKYWQKESVDLEHIQLAQQNMSNSPVYISTFAHSSKHGHLIPYSFKEATCIFLQVSSTQESTTSVHGFLAQTGRQVQKVVGDGNYFLRCLSMQLFQSQDQHYAIRSVLARFKNLNRGTFEKMLMPAVNELTFSGHIRKLITPCAWATHVEVMAAATYFQVPVLTPPKQSTDGNVLPHKVLLHTLDTQKLQRTCSQGKQLFPTILNLYIYTINTTTALYLKRLVNFLQLFLLSRKATFL